MMTKQCTLIFLRAGKHNERAPAERGNARAPRNKVSHESLPLQLTSIIVAKRFDALKQCRFTARLNDSRVAKQLFHKESLQCPSTDLHSLAELPATSWCGPPRPSGRGGPTCPPSCPRTPAQAVMANVCRAKLKLEPSPV